MDKRLLETVENFRFDLNTRKMFGISSAILWGGAGNTEYPVLYFRKPKHISDEDYQDILKNMKITITRGS